MRCSVSWQQDAACLTADAELFYHQDHDTEQPPLQSRAAQARAESLAFYGGQSPWRSNQDATVLGYEIDHLRLFGWPVRDIASHLRCTPDAVIKWIKHHHPEPVDTWDVA